MLGFLAVLLTAILFTLKLTGIITIGWAVVFAPVLAWLVFAAVMIAFVIGGAVIVAIFGR